MENYNINYLILFGLLAIVLYFVLRELNCWYWKINKRIELQEETNRLLKKIIENNTKEVIIRKEDVSLTEQISVNNPKVMDDLIEKFKGKIE